MFEPGTVTKYVPIRPLGPFLRGSPNQHITNRAYHYSNSKPTPGSRPAVTLHSQRRLLCSMVHSVNMPASYL
ncbi:hypothetical protein HaLaN_24438 [Haematococcus lacustris]|uniref:Uncharacterized protein n=1 Tax=Haematococcus lacustris TaxID=44745 RepID=A0A6A0A3E1_HAELA|nr:hypothetical protein HaLaN_24438 [Haematococcus lacustris]